MPELDDRVAVVTGASGGLGRAIAEAFGAAGARTVVAARRPDKVAEVADGITTAGGTALAVPCDVTEESDGVALFAATNEAYGRVDVLVNNAGITVKIPTEEIPLEVWRNVLDVNITGPFLCAREAIKSMKRTGGGRIINIGSISAKTPRPHGAPYATTKLALEGLTRSISLDGREHGIAASIIHLGATFTGQGFGSSLPNETRSDDAIQLHAADVARIAVMMAALPAEATVFDLTVLPVAQPSFIGRG
jgi:NAD(P)-dependent dehydrogenase (short-subunit alcohol dehydrogenase family)